MTSPILVFLIPGFLTCLSMYAIMYMQGGIVVLNTNITNFRKNIFELLEQTIRYGEPIDINTKTGDAVLISEEGYNDLMETLHLSSLPKGRMEIIEGLHTSLEDCPSENEATR